MLPGAINQNGFLDIISAKLILQVDILIDISIKHFCLEFLRHDLFGQTPHRCMFRGFFLRFGCVGGKRLRHLKLLGKNSFQSHAFGFLCAFGIPFRIADLSYRMGIKRLFLRHSRLRRGNSFCCFCDLGIGNDFCYFRGLGIRRRLRSLDDFRCRSGLRGRNFLRCFGGLCDRIRFIRLCARGNRNSFFRLDLGHWGHRCFCTFGGLRYCGGFSRRNGLCRSEVIRCLDGLPFHGSLRPLDRLLRQKTLRFCNRLCAQRIFLRTKRCSFGRVTGIYRRRRLRQQHSQAVRAILSRKQEAVLKACSKAVAILAVFRVVAGFVFCLGFVIHGPRACRISWVRQHQGVVNFLPACAAVIGIVHRHAVIDCDKAAVFHAEMLLAFTAQLLNFAHDKQIVCIRFSFFPKLFAQHFFFNRFALFGTMRRNLLCQDTQRQNLCN